MTDIERDEEREHRIEMEIVVDCYDEYERASGWECCLGDSLNFPFKAKCIEELRVSPLKEGEVVSVLDLIPLEDGDEHFFVEIEWNNRTMGVPLHQLQGVDVDDETDQMIEDWKYWVAQGYGF